MTLTPLDPVREALRASEMARVRAKFHYWTVSDHAALLRRLDGRDALIRRVREDLARAMYPQTRPVFNGWLGRKDGEMKGPDPWLELAPEIVADWRRRHPEATCSTRTASALAWLEATCAAMTR